MQNNALYDSIVARQPDAGDFFVTIGQGCLRDGIAAGVLRMAADFAALHCRGIESGAEFPVGRGETRRMASACDGFEASQVAPSLSKWIVPNHSGPFEGPMPAWCNSS
jgi:hypothetical protein